MTELPEHVDVLIVGAGPAGSAAGITLAAAGREVLMIDRDDFPRDKVCGDGLIPDAIQALEQLGVLSAVMQAATTVQGVTCHGPGGKSLKVPARLAVLPRKVLDHQLVLAAIDQGARLSTGVSFEAPLIESSRVVGAHVMYRGQSRTIRANWTLLATGANTKPLKAANLCTRSLPSAMALRAYIYNPSFTKNHPESSQYLHIGWHRSFSPGYGWIFPGPNHTYNVGVGLYDLHGTQQRSMVSKLLTLNQPSPQKANLHEIFKHFVNHMPMAGALLQTGQILGKPQGAPLRCSLKGARPAIGGLLAVGEAVGSTYALTGEGIGKALETGVLGARAVLEHSTDQAICGAYESSLNVLQPKFEIYDKTNIINRLPWLIDLAIARGQRSPKLVSRMSQVLEEKANPAKIFTARGLWKFLTQ
jgi:menaquinone-9 beta-reductase